MVDATGRLVRTLWRGSAPAGTRVLGWNARDDAGRAVTAGTYFVLLRADGRHATTKIVIVR